MDQTTDTLFEALANDQRREILFDLVEQQSQAVEPISLDAPPDTPNNRKETIIQKHHVHLPKLNEFGFINWDPDMHTVEPGDRFEEIRPALELLRTNRETLPVDSS